MRVAVVGLGMAGLRAAVLLRRAGLDVTAFEARTRVGGRVHTIDRGQGAAYEAGGEWVDADHTRTRALLTEHGEAPVPADNDPELFVHRGARARADRLWPDVVDAEARLDEAARTLLQSIPPPPWNFAGVDALDRRTLAELVAEVAQTERGRWWLTATYRADEGEELDRVGLLGWLAGYRLYLERDGSELCALRAPRGFGPVLEAMQAELGDAVHLGRELVRIERTPRGVTLALSASELDEDGAREEATFDRVVLALPPRLVRALAIEPALGGACASALGAIGTGRAVKLVLEFDEPWWLREDGWRGKMTCDLPIQQTWSAGLGAAPLLAVYACGDDAERWRRATDPATDAVDQLASLFPRARRSFVRGWRHDWVEERFTRGGFSHLAPGFASKYLRAIRSEDDRIHFAGEHTAEWSGFIEGALESAERVAAELVRAARGVGDE